VPTLRIRSSPARGESQRATFHAHPRHLQPRVGHDYRTVRACTTRSPAEGDPSARYSSRTAAWRTTPQGMMRNRRSRDYPNSACCYIARPSSVMDRLQHVLGPRQLETNRYVDCTHGTAEQYTIADPATC
jgi:hypothetical protein